MIASLIYWVVVVGLIVWGVWMAILSAYWASQKQNGNIFFIAIMDTVGCLGRHSSSGGSSTIKTGSTTGYPAPLRQPTS